MRLAAAGRGAARNSIEARTPIPARRPHWDFQSETPRGGRISNPAERRSISCPIDGHFFRNPGQRSPLSVQPKRPGFLAPVS
jgi:hypothetical protein